MEPWVNYDDGHLSDWAWLNPSLHSYRILLFGAVQGPNWIIHIKVTFVGTKFLQVEQVKILGLAPGYEHNVLFLQYLEQVFYTEKQTWMYITISTDEKFMAVAFWFQWNKKYDLWKCTFHRRIIGSYSLWKTFFHSTKSPYPVSWYNWVETSQIRENSDSILNIPLKRLSSKEWFYNNSSTSFNFFE